MGKTIESIIFDLDKLTEDSKVVSNNLSIRLQDIQRWIHKKKPGLIKSKKHLVQFLNELITDKQNEWLKTLSHWKINRGLFISFNPTLPDVNEKIARCVVIHSDLKQNICYCVVNMDK